jgi:D-alanyl-D-alanine carboxypeptidase/D-alanyl-D-alanine-endopeptidase (penicillin-binding protein 4)
VSLCGAVQAQTLTQRLDALLDAPPLNRHLWGIAVADSNGRTMFARNADRLFIPASNTKLLVTAAAAVLLPPDWTAQTSLYASGPVVNGVLQGHLVLYGRGDPTMGRRCFAVDTTLSGACQADAFAPLRELARGLAARGITAIAGDVVGDGSWFEPAIIHPAWETGDLVWWYAAPVSGLGFTDNSLEVVATPTTPGSPATVTFSPDFGNVVLENRTVTVPETSRPTYDIARDPVSGHLVATGNLPMTGRSRRSYVAVEDPNLYTALALRQALAESGIAVLGGTRSTVDSMLFRDARNGAALTEVNSRALRDWIFPILNTSQNWYAEMLLKALGRTHAGEGSWTAGLGVVRRFLIDSVRVDSTEVSQSDGSGLSAQNLVTPAAFLRILSYMRRHPRYEAFAAGLPRAGLPGSLRNRFAGTPLEGQVLAKTGSIAGVNTLSGYVTRPDGTVFLVSIQANHHTIGGRAMIAAIDSVVVAVVR